MQDTVFMQAESGLYYTSTRSLPITNNVALVTTTKEKLE